MIDEADRRQLWHSLTDSLGERQADTLMTMLPAQPLPDLATREDMTGLRAEVQVEISALRNEMQSEFRSVRSEMKSEFRSVRSEMAAMHTDLQSQIQGLEHRTNAELTRQISAVREDMSQLRGDTVGWILALGAVMITMFAAVITLGLTGAFA